MRVWSSCVVAAGALLAAEVWRRRSKRRTSRFETPLDRTHTLTVKHGLAKLFFGPEADVNPLPLKLWLADMELPTAEPIQRAIIARARHPAYGYTYQPDAIWQLVSAWLSSRHGWQIQPSCFVFSPCIVTSFCGLIRALTQPSEGVLVMTPLYAPLQEAVHRTGRQLVRHELMLDARTGRFEMGVEERLVRLLPGVRLLLLCSPHNPGGVVWTRAELRALAEACARHDVTLVADEIWQDWALFGHAHVPAAVAAGGTACRVVTMGSPTKTWNLAGLHCSYVAFAADEAGAALRQRYLAEMEPAYLTFGGTFATIAMLAAYAEGLPWLIEAKAYVEANVRYLESALRERVPEVVVLRPQATYLVLLDFRLLSLSSDELRAFLVKRARLLLSHGAQFDPTGDFGQYQRLNCACARAVLTEAVWRLESAVEALKDERAALRRRVARPGGIQAWYEDSSG